MLHIQCILYILQCHFCQKEKKHVNINPHFLHFNDNLKILYIHVLFYSIKLHIEPLSTYVINLRLE